MKFIAERKLLYSVKGDEVRNEFVIRLGEPYPLQEGMVNFPIKGGVAGCHIVISGLSETYTEDVYGADTLQAVQLASNAIDPLLKRLTKKYDLYHLNGETYF